MSKSSSGHRLIHKTGLSGGRCWWAHFEFTRINIEPIILRKKIEDVREAGAFMFAEAGRRGRIVGIGRPYAVTED